ncbi:MAG: hypothetical protein H6621_00040 [Halobacteriovoraceae bacterium]|nr:hypothetical protein [Halobacteriovoraceae bacterium]MCB9093429.1 hypothetical protein [Halobacteriovoraceae bacterium]
MSSWIFNSSGVEKILELNSSLKQKTIEEFNRVSSRSEKVYSPWMCCFSDHQSLSSILWDDNFFINNCETLNVLARAYKIPEAKQVFLNGKETKSISIDLPVQKDYEEKFQKAFKLIQKNQSILSQLFVDLVKHVVPLRTVPNAVQKIGVGFSSQYARGAIFLGVPSLENISYVQLAINLAHEIGHQALMIYQSADQIIENGLHEDVYSYVRKCNRPAIQAFHASMALAYMVLFLRNINHAELSSQESNFARESLKTLEKDFKDSVLSFRNMEFSEVGRLLYGDLCKYAS